MKKSENSPFNLVALWKYSLSGIHTSFLIEVSIHRDAKAYYGIFWLCIENKGNGIQNSPYCLKSQSAQNTETRDAKRVLICYTSLCFRISILLPLEITSRYYISLDAKVKRERRGKTRKVSCHYIIKMNNLLFIIF